MPVKRGGFFGKIISGIGNFFKPIVNTVTSLFGGAKEAAKQVGHNAIDRGAQAMQQGLRTGDYRGAARQFARGTRGDAQGTYHQQYDRARDTMRRQVSQRIDSGHRQFGQHMRKQYGQYRQHPRWEQRGMRRPPTYNSYFGAGFGKAHFKKLEKKAHTHIGKIFARAKKAHRAQHTKAGKSKTKAQRKREITRELNAAHKEAKGGYLKFHKETVAQLKEAVRKKGAGIAVGAGTKVGAGMAGRSFAEFKKKRKKGAGTKVGAGVKLPKKVREMVMREAVKQTKGKKKPKLGGMHLMDRSPFGAGMKKCGGY